MPAGRDRGPHRNRPPQRAPVRPGSFLLHALPGKKSGGEPAPGRKVRRGGLVEDGGTEADAFAGKSVHAELLEPARPAEPATTPVKERSQDRRRKKLYHLNYPAAESWFVTKFCARGPAGSVFSLSIFSPGKVGRSTRCRGGVGEYRVPSPLPGYPRVLRPPHPPPPASRFRFLPRTPCWTSALPSVPPAPGRPPAPFPNRLPGRALAERCGPVWLGSSLPGRPPPRPLRPSPTPRATATPA